jgi:UDP-N-acetylmuramyl pentapeptide phosphotransferase/UDP-N-acetylglucosamine-1-phosphate transferase
MSRLDVIKEKINYLKVWLGIAVVTLIGLLGWISSHYEILSTVRLVLSFIGIIWLIVLIHFLNKSILQKINSLEDL